MGRINHFFTLAVAVPVVLFAAVSCKFDNIYDSLRNEVTASKEITITYSPSMSKIGKTDPISLKFSYSIDTDSFKYSGSIADSTKSIVWSKTDLDNDTVTFTPVSIWSYDTSLGTTTASLYYSATTTDGWSFKTVTWTPELQ